MYYVCSNGDEILQNKLCYLAYILNIVRQSISLLLVVIMWVSLALVVASFLAAKAVIYI